MQHLDEGMIHAWLDGALLPEEAASVEAHVETCSECQARVAEARGLIAASSRILSALDNVPSGVIPVRAPRRKRWYDRADFRAAAAVLLVAGTSLIVVRFGSQKSERFSAATSADRVAPLASSIADSAPPAVDQSLHNPVRQLNAEAPKSQPANADSRAVKKVAARQAEEVQKNEQPLAIGGTVGGIRRLDEADAGAVAQKAATPTAVAAAPPALDRVKDSTTIISATAGEKLRATAGASIGNFLSAKGMSEVKNDLRLVRTDTIGGDTRRSVYQLDSGVQVTLTDAPQSVDDLRDAPAPSPVVMRAAERAPAAAMAKSVPAMPAINTISWTEGKRRYTLSGPLSVSDLEAIKSRLIKLRR